MPRMMNRRLMDYMMRRDGRNPYGSEGGYVVSSRRGRRDRARGRDYAGDMAQGGRGGDRGMDYEYDMARGGRGRDRGDYGDYEGDMARGRGGRGQDGHYGREYYPIEAMGRFEGYYGMGEDFARGGRGGGRGGDRAGGRDYGYEDYEYDMARGGGRDRGYYDMAGDYGENLTKEELEHWKKKLMKESEEKDKQFFTKENIGQKAKQLGIEMKEYNEEELVVATAMMFSDYSKAIKPYVGANMDIYIKLADAFLRDKDASVKGGEKLAVYFDCIVDGEDD